MDDDANAVDNDEGEFDIRFIEVKNFFFSEEVLNEVRGEYFVPDTLRDAEGHPVAMIKVDPMYTSLYITYCHDGELEELAMIKFDWGSIKVIVLPYENSQADFSRKTVYKIVDSIYGTVLSEQAADIIRRAMS